jgi:hypothetical protein
MLENPTPADTLREDLATMQPPKTPQDKLIRYCMEMALEKMDSLLTTEKKPV